MVRCSSRRSRSFILARESPFVISIVIRSAALISDKRRFFRMLKKRGVPARLEVVLQLVAVAPA